MKNKFDDNPSHQIWKFLISAPFKILITQHQDQLPLRNMAKKMIRDQVKKENLINFMLDI